MQRKLFGAAVAAVLTLSLMGASCQNIKEANPLTVACSAVQGQSVDVAVCAFATYGTFVVFEEQAVELARDLKQRADADGTASDVREALTKAKNAIISADEAAKPIADRMNDALQELIEIQAELEVGVTHDQKVQIATANLRRWVNEASPLIQELVNAVKGGNKP